MSSSDISGITVRPSQVRAILSAYIAAGYPVLLTGAPGVGKTDLVLDAVRRAKANYQVSHPVVSDPTDAKGLPWKVDGEDRATFLPFGDLQDALSAPKDKPFVWFLDDLGQATPAVQASFMQLILARKINGHAIPENVVFIAATNRRSDRAGVQGILEPVKSRFKTILAVTPDANEWSQWALANNVAPEVVSFIRTRPDKLHEFKPGAVGNDIVNQPSPRTWKALSDAVQLRLPNDVQLPAFAGAVGEPAAVEFTGYLRIIEQAPDLDELLKSPEKAPIPEDPGILYAVVTGLVYKSNLKTWPAIATYAHRLFTHAQGEFSTYLIRDCVQRDKNEGSKIVKTREFIKLAESEIARQALMSVAE